MTTRHPAPIVFVVLLLLGAAGCTEGVSPEAAGSPTSPTHMADMTWVMTSGVRDSVQIRFFDRDTAEVWPSQSTHWVIEGGRTETYKLRGRKGSQICFGAALASNNRYYWGVGIGNSSGCEDCCHVAGSGDPIPIRLTTK